MWGDNERRQAPPAGVCASCKGLIENRKEIVEVEAGYRDGYLSDRMKYTFHASCWNDVANSLIR